METTKILVVEDEMIIAADISMQLDQLGYEVSGITPRGEDALNSIESTRPDIVLMDVELKGKMDGVETAVQILERFQIPVIFLTANADDDTFERAKEAKPYAFISKPFRKSDLQRAIELVVERVSSVRQDRPAEPDEVSPNLSDRIFIRHKDQMVKVYFSEILYVEADRNYCKVFTPGKEFLLSMPLRILEAQLPADTFMRTHRSFVVNLEKVDALGDHHEFLVIGKINIPVSRSSRNEVLKRLKVI